MKYEVIRTDTADEGIRKIILYAAQNFGNTVTLEKLNQIENRFLNWKKSHTLEQNPDTVFLRDKDIECLFWKKTCFFTKLMKKIKK